MNRHKIYKYASRWYFTCAWCFDVESASSWPHACYVCQEHIETKHQDLLTQPLRV